MKIWWPLLSGKGKSAAPFPFSQVCSDISNPKTLKREMRSLIKASRELNCEELLLLNPREATTETITWQNAERQIRLMPLWQWLLENS